MSILGPAKQLMTLLRGGQEVSQENPLPVAGTMQLSGSNVAEVLTESDASDGVVTFSAPIEFIQVFNRDATNAGTFTVNGISIPVSKSGEDGCVWGPTGVDGTPSAAVTVTGSTSYVLSRFV